MTILTDSSGIALVDDTEDAALLVLEDETLDDVALAIALLVENGELTVPWEDLDLGLELLVSGGALIVPVVLDDGEISLTLQVSGGDLTTGADYIYYTAELIHPECSVDALIPTCVAELLQPSMEITYFVHKKTEDD